MNRCKYCNEVLDGYFTFCPNCGKRIVSKKEEKELYQAKVREENGGIDPERIGSTVIKRPSYIVFGILSVIVGALAFILYGDKFLALIGLTQVAEGYHNFLAGLFNGFIYNNIIKVVPHSLYLQTLWEESLEKVIVTFMGGIAVVALVLIIISFFTKKTCLSSIFAKVSTILALLLVITIEFSHLYPEAMKDFMENNKSIIVLSLGGGSLGFFIASFVLMLACKAKYKIPAYLFFRALFWTILAVAIALYGQTLFNIDAIKGVVEFIGRVCFLAVPIYLIVAGIFRFACSSYKVID